MIYYTAGLSLSRIPSLAAYKRAWRIFVGDSKRSWKFVGQADDKKPKPLGNSDYFATAKIAKLRTSNAISNKNLILNNSTILHCDRNISALPKIPSLPAYKRAWRVCVGYAKRSQRGGLENLQSRVSAKFRKALTHLMFSPFRECRKLFLLKLFLKNSQI